MWMCGCGMQRAAEQRVAAVLAHISERYQSKEGIAG